MTRFGNRRATRSRQMFFWRRSLPLATCLLAGASLLIGVAPTRSEPLPLPPAAQAKINDAILEGVLFLKSTQGGDGTWAQEKDAHKVGYAALPALTLLECGVPPSHSLIQRASIYVRLKSDKLADTYDIALSIMFLDRMIATNDNVLAGVFQQNATRDAIEVLALRLIRGQTTNGGWHYSCPTNELNEHRQLLNYLKKEKITRSTMPVWLKKLAVFQDPEKLMVDPNEKKGTKPDPKKVPVVPVVAIPEPASDNSNTHFAVLGLWIAQRHGVPVERSLKLIEKRFRSGQNADGGWSYAYKRGGGEPTTPAMSCAGLIGLATSYGQGKKTMESSMSTVDKVDDAKPDEKTEAKKPDEKPDDKKPEAKKPGDKMLDSPEEKLKKRAEDTNIKKGFDALAAHIGQPVGKFKDVPLGNMYFLWALERVAMIYDMPKIADKDWYRWGAEMLVANQKEDGHWEQAKDSGVTAISDTCFALLFLRQANLADDLTALLRADPDALEKRKAKKPQPAKPAAPESKVASAPPINAGQPRPAPSAPPVAQTKPAETQPTVTEVAKIQPPPVTASAPATTTEAPSKAGMNPVILWGGGAAAVLLLGVAGTLLVLAMKGKPAQAMDADDEDEGPRRKKKSSRQADVEEEEVRPRKKRR